MVFIPRCTSKCISKAIAFVCAVLVSSNGITLKNTTCIKLLTVFRLVHFDPVLFVCPSQCGAQRGHIRACNEGVRTCLASPLNLCISHLLSLHLWPVSFYAPFLQCTSFLLFLPGRERQCTSVTPFTTESVSPCYQLHRLTDTLLSAGSCFWSHLEGIFFPSAICPIKFLYRFDVWKMWRILQNDMRLVKMQPLPGFRINLPWKSLLRSSSSDPIFARFHLIDPPEGALSSMQSQRQGVCGREG